MTSAAAGPPAPSRWLALALLVAFSPALVELLGHLASVPRDRYALVAPVLFALAAWSERDRVARPRWDGSLAIAAAVLLQLAGIALATWSAARLGLALAAFGLARLRGWPTPRSALLAFGAVPIPLTLLEAPSPALENALASAAAGLLSALGLGLETAGHGLRAGSGLLPLRVDHGGGPLALVAAELCWLAGVRLGWSLVASLALCLLATLAGLALQLGGVLLAGVLLAAGGEGLAALLLDRLWLGLAAAGILGILYRPARVSLARTQSLPPGTPQAGNAADHTDDRTAG